jgi:hypothetical protein
VVGYFRLRARGAGSAHPSPAIGVFEHCCSNPCNYKSRIKSARCICLRCVAAPVMEASTAVLKVRHPTVFRFALRADSVAALALVGTNLDHYTINLFAPLAIRPPRGSVSTAFFAYR